jgi:hypothetical protein
MNITIVTIILPIIAGLVGSYLTYYFTLKSKRMEAMMAFKEKSYESLLLKAQVFFGESNSPEAQKEFIDQMYKSWLYCSDDVVKAINQMLALLSIPGDERKHDRYGHESFGNLVIAIRQDLLGKSSLTHKDFNQYKVRVNNG